MFVQVNTPSNSYHVEVRSGVLEDAGERIEEVAPASSYLIIVDEYVANAYLNKLTSSFSKKVHTFIVPSGEQSKSFQMYEVLSSYCLECKLDRSSVIVAFGGGVVGDLAGFVAGTYMRGIRFVQLPTTLLAHDSSVGGKVAINLPAGKNMVGVFHQPEVVLFDTDLLQTLPMKQWRSGFAEIVKLGLIADEAFYHWLIKNVTSLDHIEENVLSHMVGKAIEIKAEIVTQDEREHGIRAFLNLGHTLGHAIEAEVGYGELTHGEAVAIGIDFALKVSRELLGSLVPLEQYRSWFFSLGYSLKIPTSLDIERLLIRMLTDKKASHSKLVMVLLERTGKARTQEVEIDKIRNMLKRELEDAK